MQNFEPIFRNDGYRPNVGIIICNENGKVFWGRRITKDGWQFPQGGVCRDESLVDAMYRELQEETGLQRQQVEIVAHTKSWLHYDLPRRFLRNQHRHRLHRRERIPFKGQRQVWFLLQLLGDDSAFDLSAIATPEFDRWRWVDTRFALENIVDFKRSIYKKALNELGRHLPSHQ